jgi:hypothetical protein
MSIDQLSDWIDREYRNGLSYLAGMGRTLAERTLPHYPRWSPRLDDRLHLEPLLFTHCALRARDRHLWQICFGYADPASRPATLRVRTNRDGVICLPRLGYLATNRPDRELELEWDGVSQTVALFSRRQPVPHEFLPLRNVEATSIDFGCHAHPLLAHLTGESGSTTPRLAQAHGAYVDRAFAIVRQVYPGYAEAIAAATSRLVLFRNAKRNSFADLSCFGTAFLNVTEPEPDEVFFVEDIVHQCGHILFSALTHNTDDILAVPAATSLKDQTRNDFETRTIYTTLHGLFTEAAMSLCLDRCLRLDVFSGRQRHECRGRLGYIFLRFYHDLVGMRERSLYTDKGNHLYGWLCDIFRDIYARQGEQLRELDLSDQPYTFSFDVFERRNPLPRHRPFRHRRQSAGRGAAVALG